jgi:acetyl esterase/lipase
MLSLRARLVRFLIRQIFRRIDADADIERLRLSWEQLAARSRAAPDVRMKDEDLAGVECEWLVPSGCQDAPVLLYLHGGAYVSGSSATHRSMVSHIARASGMRALVPNYRLAPEHPFPAGLEDCLAVYRALLDDGIDAARIAVGGDSAGGGMTMATLLSLRDSGDPLPRAAVLLSPWLDLSGSGESTRTRADHDPMFDAAEMPKAAAYYVPRVLLQDPLVSPVFADVHGLPPILIQVGDHEILLSDSTRIADKIVNAGGKVTLQVWPHMWHVFQYSIGRMPESKRAVDDIGAYLQACFEAAPRDGTTAERAA